MYVKYNTRDEQSAAKHLTSNEYGESSETIPRGSTLHSCPNVLETESTLVAIKVKGEDIVQNQNTRFLHFLKRARNMHGDKYDYCKVEYVNAKVTVLIICPIHGEFWQVPDKHLAKNSKGCPKCWRDIMSFTFKGRTYDGTVKLLPKKDYLDRVNTKYNFRYTYNMSEYKGLTQGYITLICPEHGACKLSPQAHLQSQYGCPSCAKVVRVKNKTNSYDDIVKELGAIHNNIYQYPEDNRELYVNQHSKIVIVCEKHGRFIKSVQKHKEQICPKCSYDILIASEKLPGGYNEELFIRRPLLKEAVAYLYYLTINNGESYKIGVTTMKSVKQRINGIRSKAVSCGVEIDIKTIYSFKTTLYEAYCREQQILSRFKEFRRPTTWSTELFNRDVLENEEIRKEYFD